MYRKPIRIVVVHELPEEEQNIVCQLFSARDEQVRFAATIYKQQSSKSSTLIDDLLSGYREVGISMPYTMEDYERDYKKRFLERLSVEERLAGLKPEEILRAVSPEDIFKFMPRDAVERFLKNNGRESSDHETKPNDDGGKG